MKFHKTWISKIRFTGANKSRHFYQIPADVLVLHHFLCVLSLNNTLRQAIIPPIHQNVTNLRDPKFMFLVSAQQLESSQNMQ